MDVERYDFTNGWSMEREPEHPFYWIVRDEAGQQVDRDKYRHDAIERHRLVLASHGRA